MATSKAMERAAVLREQLVAPRTLRRLEQSKAVQAIATRVRSAAAESASDINWARLAEMRTHHSTLRGRYSTTAASARAAAAEVGRVRAAALADAHDDGAVRFLAQPLAVLQAMGPDDIAVAGHDPRAVRRLVGALLTAQTLHAETEALAAKVKASAALLDNLNAFVRRFE